MKKILVMMTVLASISASAVECTGAAGTLSFSNDTSRKGGLEITLNGNKLDQPTYVNQFTMSASSVDAEAQESIDYTLLSDSDKETATLYSQYDVNGDRNVVVNTFKCDFN